MRCESFEDLCVSISVEAERERRTHFDAISTCDLNEFARRLGVVANVLLNLFCRQWTRRGTSLERDVARRDDFERRVIGFETFGICCPTESPQLEIDVAPFGVDYGK